MRFIDFLRTTVLACAAAATVLGALAIRSVALEGDTALLVFSLAWWALATVVGAWLGRERATLPAIARLLAGARSTTTLPEQAKPGRVARSTGCGRCSRCSSCRPALAWLFPQIPAIAAGFLAIWALYWRRQEAAVTAIEERDGVAFYVEQTKPWKPIQLVRTPGFRRIGPPVRRGPRLAPRAAGRRAAPAGSCRRLHVLDVEELEADPDDEHAAGARQRVRAARRRGCPRTGRRRG